MLRPISFIVSNKARSLLMNDTVVQIVTLIILDILITSSLC